MRTLLWDCESVWHQDSLRAKLQLLWPFTTLSPLFNFYFLLYRIVNNYNLPCLHPIFVVKTMKWRPHETGIWTFYDMQICNGSYYIYAYRQIIVILIKSHCNKSWHFSAETVHVVLVLFPVNYTAEAKGHPGEVGPFLAYFVPYVTVHIQPPQVLHSKYLWSWASCFTNPNGKYFKAA